MKNVRLDQVRCAGARPHSYAFKPARVNPIKLAYDTRQPDGRPHSDQCLYPNSPVCQKSWYRAYCYAELVVSSLAVTQTTTSTHCAYPTHGWMARLNRAGWLWLNTKMVYPRTVTHPSTNLARRRATTNALPLNQAAIQVTNTEIDLQIAINLTIF